MKLGRKLTGGKYHRFRKKKLYAKQGQERVVELKETKRKKLRVVGGNIKIVLLGTKTANIKMPNGKVQKAEIKNVVQTPQNVFLARQNRLMKSAIIETTLGKARITNRPSQEGQVNAVLIEAK